MAGSQQWWKFEKKKKRHQIKWEFLWYLYAIKWTTIPFRRNLKRYIGYFFVERLLFGLLGEQKSIKNWPLTAKRKFSNSGNIHFLTVKANSNYNSFFQISTLSSRKLMDLNMAKSRSKLTTFFIAKLTNNLSMQLTVKWLNFRTSNICFLSYRTSTKSTSSTQLPNSLNRIIVSYGTAIMKSLFN